MHYLWKIICPPTNVNGHNKTFYLFKNNNRSLPSLTATRNNAIKVLNVRMHNLINMNHAIQDV